MATLSNTAQVLIEYAKKKSRHCTSEATDKLLLDHPYAKCLNSFWIIHWIGLHTQ